MDQGLLEATTIAQGGTAIAHGSNALANNEIALDVVGGHGRVGNGKAAIAHVACAIASELEASGRIAIAHGKTADTHLFVARLLSHGRAAMSHVVGAVAL